MNWNRIGFLFVLVCARIAAQEMCGSPLPDWLLPGEENYQKQYAGGNAGDIYDRLHTIPLGPAGSNRYLSLGGQEREWYESYSTAPFGNGPEDANGYLLQRYMLHLDAHLGSRTRIFVEFKGDLENGRLGGPRPDIDEDRGDLNQAFVEFDLTKRKTSRFTLRVGRQEFLFGSGRLVDVREGPNVRRGFDGAKLTYCSDETRIDAVAARPVLNRPGAFDDVPGHGTTFAGLYGSRRTPWLLRGNTDLYYLVFDQKQSQYVSGTADEQRHTIGVRLWKLGEGWDHDLEVIDQFGRFGERGIQAWGVSLNTGYNFSRSWRPRLGIKAGIASGDSGAARQDLGTFNPLFASLHYFGEEGLAGPANFTDLRPEFDIHPRKNVRLSLSSDWFWRHRLTDGIYLPGPILLVPPNGSHARYIGNQSAVEIEWDPSPHWTTATYWSHFLNGQFLNEATSSKNLNYVAGWISFHF